eukprot:jgi/Tetstr1/439189/TSEL_027634.t1
MISKLKGPPIERDEDNIPSVRGFGKGFIEDLRIKLPWLGLMIGVKFLPLYAWRGIFLSIYLFLGARCSACRMQFALVTRLQEEAFFSLLISVIFIFEAVKYFFILFTDPDVSHGEAKAGLFVGLLTSSPRCPIRGFRNGPSVQPVDSQPMLFIGHYGIEKIDLDFLPFATGDITATTLGTDVRPWFIDLTDINDAGIGLFSGGGPDAFIVIYFDQNITVRLVNAREHMLKKGYGYDMDMMALCICTIILSLLGCPWMVSATVPSLNHCRSLCFFGNEGNNKKGDSDKDDSEAKLEEESMKAIQKGTQITGCLEQRVTPSSPISSSCWRCCSCAPHLGSIPLAVLRGLFMYNGWSNLAGNEFWERLFLPITDKTKLPNKSYCKVKMWKAYAWTAIQLVCLVAVLALMRSTGGRGVPLAVAALQSNPSAAGPRMSWLNEEEVEALDSHF